VRIDTELQRDFSLHHSLSLYLVEAIAAFDPQSETLPFDVLSLVEAILENPRAILYQQEHRAKDELIARLKAERVPYEERMTELEKVSWPKPNEDLVRATFELFRERHPWVRDEDIRPKGIASEMAESYSSFDDFVKRNQLARMEGVLLRYLSQVWNALVHNVPSAAMTDELHDLTSYLRATITQVDSSLISEWESLVSPTAEPAAAPEAPQPPTPEILRDERAFRARVRAECHRLVRALSKGAYDEAAHALRESDEPWTPERIEQALDSFHAEYDRVVFEPRARAADKTWIQQREPRLWEVQQTLVDDRDENLWSLQLEVDLRDGIPEGPLITLHRIAI
jgi:superfamily II RNA helicase